MLPVFFWLSSHSSLLQARIKAKPLLRSTFVPKNGFKQTQAYDPNTVYNPQQQPAQTPQTQQRFTYTQMPNATQYTLGQQVSQLENSSCQYNFLIFARPSKIEELFMPVTFLVDSPYLLGSCAVDNQWEKINKQYQLGNFFDICSVSVATKIA